MDLDTCGFFPLGGGNVFSVILGLKKGEHLRPVTLVERGHVKRIRGICYFYNMLYNLYNLSSLFPWWCLVYVIIVSHCTSENNITPFLSLPY